jgi:hypothetical protein
MHTKKIISSYMVTALTYTNINISKCGLVRNFTRKYTEKLITIINLKTMKTQGFGTYNLLHGQFKIINLGEFVLNEVTILKACLA